MTEPSRIQINSGPGTVIGRDVHGNITVNIISSEAAASPISDEETHKSPEPGEQQVTDAAQESDLAGATTLGLVLLGMSFVGWLAHKVFGFVQEVAAVVGHALDWVAPGVAILGGVIAVLGLAIVVRPYVGRCWARLARTHEPECAELVRQTLERG